MNLALQVGSLATAALLLLAGCAAGGGALPKPVPPVSNSPASAPSLPPPAATQAPSAVPAEAAAGAVPNVGTQSAGSAGSAGGPAQTPAERRAALERKLDTSLGSFDRDLASERERVAKERDARAAQGGSAATVAANADNSTDTSGSAAGSATGPKPPGGRPGDLHSERGAREESAKRGDPNAPATATGNGAVARNIPDGSDDDIVARRLRKAAEQETDPELKERLWQEYVEYKRSGQNKG